MTQYPPQASRSNFYAVVKAEASSTPPLSTNMANSTVVPGKVPGTPGPAGRLSPEGAQVRQYSRSNVLDSYSICITHNIYDLMSSLQVLSKKKLQDLVREIDPNEQLDEDVEEVLNVLLVIF